MAQYHIDFYIVIGRIAGELGKLIKVFLDEVDDITTFIITVEIVLVSIVIGVANDNLFLVAVCIGSGISRLCFALRLVKLKSYGFCNLCNGNFGFVFFKCSHGLYFLMLYFHLVFVV